MEKYKPHPFTQKKKKEEEITRNQATPTVKLHPFKRKATIGTQRLTDETLFGQLNSESPGDFFQLIVLQQNCIF